MEKQELSKEIAAVEKLIAEEARIDELVEELVDVEEHARHGRSVPHARHYKIKVDATFHVVHCPNISGEEILRLAGRLGPLVFDVVQHLHGGREELIVPEAIVDLRAAGVERFTTVPKIVQITVDSRSVPIQAGSYSLSDLNAKLSVGSGRVLDQVVGGEFRELSDQHRIEIAGGEIFVSHVRTGQSS